MELGNHNSYGDYSAVKEQAFLYCVLHSSLSSVNKSATLRLLPSYKALRYGTC